MSIHKKDSGFGALVIMVVVIIAVIVGSIFIWRGVSNKQMFDATYSFERAVIWLPNGEIVDGKVTSWKDFDDGDQIQVKIDGKTYLTHIMNVALISN